MFLEWPLLGIVKISPILLYICYSSNINVQLNLTMQKKNTNEIKLMCFFLMYIFIHVKLYLPEVP